MHLFLEPIDVWLFRDGRPFDATSDHRAESLFPPYPTVIQGAIRSHHLVVKNIPLNDPQRIADTVGTTDNFKSLTLRGPFVAKCEGGEVVPLFPLPADAVPEKAGKDDELARFHSLAPRPAPTSVRTSATRSPEQQPASGPEAGIKLPMLLWSDGEPQKADYYQWLTEEQLVRCLKGEPVTPTPSRNLWTREPRFGIRKKHDTHTVEEGMLYEASFIRPREHVGLLVEVNGYDSWPTSGILRIGGEGRGAYFKQVELTVAKWPEEGDPLPPRFKLYFATPTCFNAGWQPLGGDWSQFFTGNVTLQAAAISRFDSLGGYDWAKNEHKLARRFVPAGSVYFFTAGGSATLRQASLTDYAPQIGFGQVIIQPWEEA